MLGDVKRLIFLKEKGRVIKETKEMWHWKWVRFTCRSKHGSRASCQCCREV